MVKDVVLGSTVAALSPRKPQRFGNEDIITFTGRPKAEFVGEGRGTSTTGTFVRDRHAEEGAGHDAIQRGSSVGRPGLPARRAQHVVRGRIEALARALDLGVYHRINPLTGTVIAGLTNYLTQATRGVEITTATLSTPELVVEAAVGLNVNSANPKPVNGLALAPSIAWGLSTERFADGRKKNPELGLGINLSSYQGIRTSVSDTVSGGSEADPAAVEAKAVRGIVGDFQDGIRWGVQRDIPVELIKFGDPDGQGDLKRYDQVALGLEIVYGWYVFTDRFVVIEDAVANV